MMTFSGRKGGELSPLPASGVSVWKMDDDEDGVLIGGTKCHVYLAWRCTTGSLTWGPNVISIGIIPGARGIQCTVVISETNRQVSKLASFSRLAPNQWRSYGQNAPWH